jgi:hypothetical protein
VPNFILVAQNTQDVDYVKQACALAMSIHATTPDSNISILTDDTIPQRYKELFETNMIGRYTIDGRHILFHRMKMQ